MAIRRRRNSGNSFNGTKSKRSTSPAQGFRPNQPPVRSRRRCSKICDCDEPGSIADTIALEFTAEYITLRVAYENQFAQKSRIQLLHLTSSASPPLLADNRACRFSRAVRSAVGSARGSAKLKA